MKTEVEVKERPILFSTPMVQAILEGRKTMTRRIIKPQPEKQAAVEIFCKEGPGSVDATELTEADHEMDELFDKCPYGKPGDILWVRETIESDEETTDTVTLSRYTADKEPVLYRTNDDYNGSVMHWTYKKSKVPSIFMPKDMCRIFLEITDIRVERIQDISQEDSQAEGVFQAPHRPASEGCTQHADNSISRDCFKCTFKCLWNRINGPLGHQWDKNEWVWVVSFRKIDMSKS